MGGDLSFTGQDVLSTMHDKSFVRCCRVARRPIGLSYAMEKYEVCAPSWSSMPGRSWPIFQ